MIRLTGVRVERDGRPILAIEDLTIGGPTAILGPNGAGKSTLVRLLLREIHPHGGEGRVEIFGRTDWRPDDVRRAIGIVSADPERAMLADPTVGEAILSGRFGTHGHLAFLEITAEDRVAAEEAARLAGVNVPPARLYSTLSSGEARRVLLARALASRPRMLLLDEPTTGLDLRARRDFLALVEGLSAVPVLVTHHPEEITPRYERVLFVKEGKIVASLAAADVTRRDVAELFGVRESDVPRLGQEG